MNLRDSYFYNLKIIAMRYALLLAALVLTSGVFAQKLKRESVSFEYMSRPSAPFEGEVSTYEVFISQPFKEGQEAAVAEWEAECERVTAQYQADLEEWNSKSTGAKILEKSLLDEGKPKLYLPAKPSINQKVFDESFLGAKIDMPGFNRAAGGAVITIELTGYESTPSEMVTKEKKSKEGVVSHEYHRKMQYRHVMRYSVMTPGGDMIIDEVYAPSESYQTHTSKTYTSSSALNKAWNETSINAKLQNSSVEANMKGISGIIKDKFCFYPKSRSWTIFYAKTSKKADYTDLEEMAFEVKYAMEDYIEQGDEAKAQLEKAVALWDKTLSEADFSDKKARVTRKLAGVMYLNLIQANIWLENYKDVDRLYDEMRRADVKNSAENSGGNLEAFCADQLARFEANQE